MQVTIEVPDNLPADRLQQRIEEIENSLKKEAVALQKENNPVSESDDPWDTLDIEAIAVDTGRTDGSVNHDHYIYGTPKK